MNTQFETSAESTQDEAALRDLLNYEVMLIGGGDIAGTAD
jgi:hypothetical protein